MQKTILLADDDLAVRRMLCRVLAEENYFVIAAVDGDDVLHLLRQNPVNLVLLDLGESDSNSRQILQKLRMENPTVPVILLSSKAKEAFVGLEIGCSALMEKPLDLFKLIRTIDELLREPIEA
jgi:two-component system response regulator ResD